MWILSNRAFNKLMGGDYTIAIDLKKRLKDLSIAELFCYQFEYNSYDGFRKFYNKIISKIINDIKFVDENSFVGKFIKLFLGK